MNYRIMNTSHPYPDVLLYRKRDENGSELVIIVAVGVIDKLDDMFASEEILFENSNSSYNFITDYSVESANNWCKLQKIKY